MGRNSRFLLCFKSIDSMESPVKPNTSSSGDTFLKYFAIGGETTADNMVFSNIFPMKDGGGHGKKNRLYSRLPRILKAAMFETSLAKAIRKKIKQKAGKPISNGVGECEEASKQGKVKALLQVQPLVSSDQDKDNQWSVSNVSTCSGCSSAFTSNSSSLSSSSLSSASSGRLISRTNSEKKTWVQLRQKQDNVKSHGSFEMGLGLVLITLLSLVFCGKICAILCTSSCLCALSRWNCTRSDEPEAGAGSESKEEIDSVKYKKKVIMEGLLQRNRGLCHNINVSQKVIRL